MCMSISPPGKGIADLSAPRHADRLPVGLRQGLPARGFVNYLEAQALVRRLETWVSREAVAAIRVAGKGREIQTLEFLQTDGDRTEMLIFEDPG